MSKPILDPPIPYNGLIQTRFIPGKLIRIEGTVLQNANRFNINLQCGPKTAPQDDTALHISVRLLEGHIVLNSLQHGIWAEELRNLTLPIKRGQNFEITLTCEFNRYKVDINGQQYCKFPQRIHYDRISHLLIDGDVSIIKISHESSSPTGIGGASGSNVLPRSPLLENSADDFEDVDSAFFTEMEPPSYEAAMSAGLLYSPDYFIQMPQPGVVPVPCNGVAVPLHPCPPQAPVRLDAFNSRFTPIRRHSTRNIYIALWVVILSAIVIILIVVLEVNSSQQGPKYIGSNSYNPTWGNSDTTRWLDQWLKDREENKAQIDSILHNRNNRG